LLGAFLIHRVINPMILRMESLNHDLQSAHARTKAIVDNTCAGIVAFSESGVIQAFNPAAVRIFGYQVGEVAGRDARVLMPDEAREKHDSFLAYYLGVGTHSLEAGRELQAVRKDGGLFPLDISIGEVLIGEE